MAICVTIDLAVDPAKVDEFLGLIKSVAPDTRAYDGCKLFDIWRDQDKPGRVLFYEIWETRPKQEKYFAWRIETGLVEKIGPYMTAPPVISYYDKYDG